MKKILIIICIFLLALLCFQVMSSPIVDRNNADIKLELQKAESIEDFTIPEIILLGRIEDYTQITQRPLFNKNRAAPYTKKTSETIERVKELSHLVLVGTARSKDISIGIVANTKKKKIERVKEGQLYDNWAVLEIEDDYILFQNEEMNYKLFVSPISKNKKRGDTLNSNKIAKTKQAIKSWANKEKYNSQESTKSKDKKVAGKIWGYDKKSNKETPDKIEKKTKSSVNNTGNNQTKRSPIIIPKSQDDESPSYYEGIDDDQAKSKAKSKADTESADEISVEDYYEDEEITEEELKTLESLGAEIFID